MTQKQEPRLLTIAELSRTLDLPESTTRYYCNRFAAHLPSVGEGRRRRFKPEAFEKLRTIVATMRRDKNAYAVDLALHNEAMGGSTTLVATGSSAPGNDPSHAFAAQMLSLMEGQTKALRDIAGAMGLFVEKLATTFPAVPSENAPPPLTPENFETIRNDINMLREQMRSAEAVHQNDLDQLRKWLTRLGEALSHSR